MFGNFYTADLIAIYCSEIDHLCRVELQQGALVSERDYVSALTTRIRDRLNHRGIPCHAQTAVPADEQNFGVDGIIIFRIGDEIKVGMFEAKRPQVTVNNYGWDYLTMRNTSHFSEQINKQRPWLGAFALWEMFFNEGAFGFASPPFDYFGSSCVWHDNAYNFMNAQGLIFNPWTTPHLNNLLAICCNSFYSIIFDIISCKAGKVFKVDTKNQRARISSPLNDNIVMNIPIPTEITNERDERVDSFMKENNLSSYTYIKLDNQANHL